jgi:hypothetical protein
MEAILIILFILFILGLVTRKKGDGFLDTLSSGCGAIVAIIIIIAVIIFIASQQ